jgi:hypothetical protein
MKYILGFQPGMGEVFCLQYALLGSPIVIDSYIIDAISSFCSREYWTRLWIVQELILASRINILCGSWICDFHRFAFFLNTARDNNVLQPHIDQNTSLEMDPGFSTVFRSQAMSIVDGRSLYVGRSPQPLVSFCKEFGSSKCEDPRDKVFRLRAFALACCSDAVPLDYAISLAEISWKLLFHHVSKDSLGKWNVSLAQEVLQALRITKQNSEDPTPFLQNKNHTEEPGGVDLAQPQCNPIDSLDIARWAEVKLGSLGESEIE